MLPTLNKLSINLAKQAKTRDIADFFVVGVDAKKRAEQFSLSAAGLYLDYSKQNINEEELIQLLQWAQASGLAEHRQAMFSGEKINHTENRAVLHTLLRAPDEVKQKILPADLAAEVLAAENNMASLVNDITTGKKKTITGQKFTDVLAIGIGGSFYGIKVGLSALNAYQKTGLKVHVLANVDGKALVEKLALLPIETTLVVVISKTFTTQETLLNAQAVKDWMLATYNNEQIIEQHWLAVSSNITLAQQFGISAENVLPMWDWVGGRFSIWSAVGLPLALAIGMEIFFSFKQGAYQLDQHFLSAPFETNMPVILALLGIWNRNFLDYSALAILPYDHALRTLPGYLQQTDMESNGKSVNHQGEPLNYATAPIVFGQEGTNAQHAFMQLMHQSDEIIPTDFIVALSGDENYPEHHQILMANCFAQAEALMKGKSLAEVTKELEALALSAKDIAKLAPHKTMKGNTPSNILLMDKLTPQALGALLVLYEHKIFVQGALWQINPFDQWGVELGKALGKDILQAMDELSDTPPFNEKLSASTQKLIALYNRVKKNLSQ